MTTEHHVDDHSDSADLFAANEWAAFRVTDTQAATAIVVEMVGIFVIGIVLYSVVLATL
jgi:hypothetical protein